MYVKFKPQINLTIFYTPIVSNYADNLVINYNTNN